jgi:hypothetical protein
MKALCSISSIEFEVQYFPGTLYSREVSHPVFYMPQKKLLAYLSKWSTPGAFTETDSYLLFLALLNSSELIHFRVPVFRDTHTAAIVANNMEHLAKTLIRINTVSTPSFNFPQFVITPETRYLQNVVHWINAWDDAYKDFKDGYRSAHENQKLIRREGALEKLIKNPYRNDNTYANAIAEWAAQAGEFPTFTINHPNGTKISCDDYWKQIIVRACKDDNIFAIDRKDLTELLEHCEEYIPIGSIYSNNLFKHLRHAMEKQKNFLGIGDIDISSKVGGGYTFISPADSVESANIRAMIQAAPANEPKRESYPSQIAYMRALMRWTLAQDSKSADESNESNESNEE